MRSFVAVLVLAAGAGRVAAQQPAQPARGWTVSGTVDAGFVSATGNTDVTTVSVGSKVGATRGKWTLRHSAAYVYGTTKGDESANQLRVGARADFTLAGPIAGFAAVVYERNAFAGFFRRVDEQLGATWSVIAGVSDSLLVDAGGVLTQQENTDGTLERTSAARVAIGYKRVLKPGAFVTHSTEYVPTIDAGGAFRLNAETAVVAPVAGRVNITIAYLVQYTSRPPVPFGRSDRVLTSGLQVSF